MQSRQISIAAQGGGQFDAYVSLPPIGKGPGLLLIQEIFGVNQHIRDVADQYAMDGFVVLAPDVFWRQEPNVDLGYDEAGFKKGFGLLQGMDFAVAEQDLCAAAAALRSLPESNGRLASLGFCMGGFLSYLVASNAGAVDAAVCYYGGGIQNALDRVSRIKTPVLMHFAEQDAYIPMQAVEQIRQAFVDRPEVAIHTHANVDHGFNCWGRPMYNQRTAALARGISLQFLANRLG
ncbi:MAG TPA: dienelactone hydrolase family protein [Limnobacter sp.]|nr:dienelactone hydrolase family protein [Limnobacter sp.]